MAVVAGCDQHSGVEKQLKNHEDRIHGLEDTMVDVQKLVVRMDTIIQQNQKMYWIMVAAVVGVIVSAIMSTILK